MNFQEMLAKQKQQNVDNLVDAGKKESETGYGPDERFWRPTLDKAGNAFAIVRFLPAPDVEIPWVKYYSHGFKGDSGQWFIENCPTSLGQDCPVCQANGTLWNSGSESDKELARKRKRRLHYVSNMLVVKDNGNPENNGKVFLYKYGAKIFNKLMGSMEPDFEDETPINPFNVFEGANFKLKVKQVEGYWNYDSSEFEKQTVLYDGDEKKLEAMFEKLCVIGDFVSPSEYKSFAELQTKFNTVLGIASNYRSEESPITRQVAQKPSVTKESTATDDSDDDMEYFRKLANSDNTADEIPF